MSNNARPQDFSGVIGQRRIISKLEVKASVYRKRNKMPRHFVLVGRPGYGKTTICKAFASLMGTNFIEVMAPEIKGAAEMQDIFGRLKQGDVLFVDEIHAFPPKVQETFYGVLEDFRMQAQAESGDPYMKSVGPFTCIAATTHVGLVNDALVSRFGRPLVMADYSQAELAQIAAGAARRQIGVELPERMGQCLAALSLGVPRLLINLTETFIEYAEASVPDRDLVSDDLNRHVLKETLIAEGIDSFLGLDSMARRYLRTLLNSPRPVGLDTLVQEVGEVKETLMRRVEPLLLSATTFLVFGEAVTGPLMEAGPRGRLVTASARLYFEGCQRLQETAGFFSDENLTLN